MTYAKQLVGLGLLLGLSFLSSVSAATNTTLTADQSTFLVVVSSKNTVTPIETATDEAAPSATATATATAVIDVPLGISTASVVLANPVHKRALPPLIVGAGWPDVPITSMPPRWYKRAVPSPSHNSESESKSIVTVTLTNKVIVMATETPDQLSGTTSEITITTTDAATTTAIPIKVETVVHQIVVTVTQDPTASNATTQDTATPVPVVDDGYSKVELPGRDCVYVDHYDLRPVKRAPANNHQAGVQDCKKRCTEDARCKLLFVFKYDPEKAKGKSGVMCQLSSNPYNQNNVQCDYMSNFTAAYIKDW